MPSSIPTQPLGRDGPLIPTLGFGAMGLSAFYGSTGTEAERLAVLDRAYGLGVWHWDTADMYSDNEDLIGKWLCANPSKRSSIFLATKFGEILQEHGLQLRSDQEYMLQACERSLKRLGVEYIDLYYCHRMDGITPIEKTAEAMAELQKYVSYPTNHLYILTRSAIGKERSAIWNFLNCQQNHCVEHTMYTPLPHYKWHTPIRAFHRVGCYTTPIHMSRARCRPVAYSPLARGFLSGRYTSPNDFEEGDFRKLAPRFSAKIFPKNLLLLRKFEEVASRKGVTSGQLCLAWLLAQGNDIFVIPG